MPFPLIPTALGVCFFLIWALIGGMIFRDGQLAVRRERESQADFVPPRPHMPRRVRPEFLTGGNRVNRELQSVG
jgi:hypothetical protein